MNAARTAGPEAGSTLVELLVVLAIIALAAGIAVPGLMQKYKTQDLAAFTDDLANRLRLARTLAIATSRPQRIQFNIETGTIRFGSSIERHLPPDTAMTITTGLETTSSDHQATLTFLSNGGASGMEINLQSPAKNFVVDVHWLTGLTAVRELR